MCRGNNQDVIEALMSQARNIGVTINFKLVLGAVKIIELRFYPKLRAAFVELLTGTIL